MILTTAAGPARWATRLRLASLVAVALLVAHTVIYAAEDGLGGAFAEAMDRAGHGSWWLPLSGAVLVAGSVTGLAWVWRLARLEGLARRGSRSPSRQRRGEPPGYRAEVVAIARRLLPLVVALFLVQENVEALTAHGRLLGFDAVLAAHPLALPVLLLVGLALAAVGALVRWRIAVLRRRIADGVGPRRPRSAASAAAANWATVGALAPRRWMLDRLDAGRSPPPALPC